MNPPLTKSKTSFQTSVHKLLQHQVVIRSSIRNVTIINWMLGKDLTSMVVLDTCVPPSFPNGVVSGSGDGVSWTGSLSCMPGFILVGSSKLKCRGGQWSANIPVCTGREDTILYYTNLYCQLLVPVIQTFFLTFLMGVRTRTRQPCTGEQYTSTAATEGSGGLVVA